MNWLREHQPDCAASFLPGLTSDEIQAVEAELGLFKLPKEIYELYQSRNGIEEDVRALRIGRIILRLLGTKLRTILTTLLKLSTRWEGLGQKQNTTK